MSQEFPNSQDEVRQNISNISIGDSNVVTFNQTQILQISIEEIKTRQFRENSPYKGLKKFEPEDKDIFFGRDQFLTGLVNELEQTNLILLLGASGSGKSSVVRAGLIPWLVQKKGSQLVHFMFTPDADPFESFYASLLSKYRQSEAQIAREAKVDTLTQVVTRLKQSESYWFILIDQFEELFTTTQPQKCAQFIASLVNWSKTKQPNVKIIATMRADFLDRLSPYSQLVKATQKHRPLIAEMQADELRLAIEQPAAHHGVVFETGLVGEIIKDIQGQAGYLPLLQYTLNLLWETEINSSSIQDRTLNTSTYRQLGGVRGALQQRVDSIYGALTKQEKLAAQSIFLKLVDIGKDSESGTEWRPVRRRALMFEFSNELERIVLVKLINENLLVSNSQSIPQESTVEITHETLLTSWTNLNIWIQENRQAIALRNRLNDDVAHWQVKKADDELWAGSKLEQILELRKDSTFNQILGGFSPTANQFIDASVGLRDRLQRRRIAVAIAFAIGGILFGLQQWYFGQEQQRFKQTNDAVFLGTDTTKILNSLPDFLKEADSLRNEGNIERSLPYYRQVRAATVKLLRNFKENPQEKLKIQKLSDKSEESLAQVIQAKLFKNLENDLKNGHYDDALKKTYDILMSDKMGAGADINQNSILDSQYEADIIPCKTLIDIREQWLKYTKKTCDWYGLDPYQAPNCTVLNQETLTTSIFQFPYDHAIQRINLCYEKFQIPVLSE
ncbi:ATP-binding protein [Nostoc favosum]|uniref:ATP-binding protein n=1 Tax=Nostoc favosum CHAB5714 TaxID=2780399 RepID=A0ABS8ICC4_9NOSO|nr:ATP-binding protein [Nostoc favosum]MCC5601840.1 ATP-binding protein [Nostoc favosum CHAB5714]